MSIMLLPSDYPRRTGGPAPADAAYWRLKRAVDVLASGFGILVLLPVFFLVAIAIKLDSRGPLIYAQERVGKNRRRRPRRAGEVVRRAGHAAIADRRKANFHGRPFNIYKFRSMVVDAEKNTGPVWAARGDSRITRVGKILRMTRLDETPQLWNVLKGDMSLVGPRPERPNFVVELTSTLPEYANRSQALPGVTGLAQVRWRYDTSIETVSRKLQYDLYYIRYGRLLLDLKIMAATFRVMVRGDGAL